MRPPPRQAYRSSLLSLELLMDGYPVDAEENVQKLLQALTSYKLLLEEVQDTAAALGNKLPADLDALLQAAYREAAKSHVDGDDTKEVAAIVAKLNSIIDDFIGEQYESKQADIRLVVAPVQAVLDRYAGGLREHALAVVCSVLTRFMSVETSFVDAASTDQLAKAVNLLQSITTNGSSKVGGVNIPTILVEAGVLDLVNDSLAQIISAGSGDVEIATGLQDLLTSMLTSAKDMEPGASGVVSQGVLSSGIVQHVDALMASDQTYMSNVECVMATNQMLAALVNGGLAEGLVSGCCPVLTTS